MSQLYEDDYGVGYSPTEADLQEMEECQLEMAIDRQSWSFKQRMLERLERMIADNEQQYSQSDECVPF